MAQATKNTIVIETPITRTITTIKKEEKDTGVRLDLSMAEAETLAVVVNRIGGDLKGSPRKYTDRIASALSAAGVVLDEGHYKVREGSVVAFEDYKQKAAPLVAEEARKEPRAVQIGDRVKIVSSPYMGETRNAGAVGVVVQGDGRGDFNVVIDGDDEPSGWGFHTDELELVTEDAKKAIEPEPLKVIEQDTAVSPKSYRAKVGDKVRVVRKVETEDGWKNSWVGSMDRQVGSGNVLTVSEVKTSGVRFEEEGFGWPHGSLELVTEAAPTGYGETPEPAPSEPPRSITMGDRVKLKEPAGSFRAGETAKVTRLGCGGAVHIESVGCGPKRTAGVTRDDVELIAA